MNVNVQLDKLFTRIDDWLLEGSFNKVDQELASVNVFELDPAIVVGYLALTAAAKHKLKNRLSFWYQAKHFFVITVGPGRTEKILKGLK